MPEIIIVGEVLYDFFAEPGKNLVESVHFTPKMGGAPANLAVSIAKLGGNVGFVGKIGSDPFGFHIKNYLASQGVDVTYVSEHPDFATMISLVALPTADTPEFIFYPGATVSLLEKEIPLEHIAAAKLLIFGGVNLPWACAQATFYAAKVARQAKKIVVFDVNYRPSIWPSRQAAQTQLLKAVTHADIVKLNAQEGQFLFGTSDPDTLAKALFQQGVKLVCLSLGDRGCVLLMPKMRSIHPGFPIVSIDATGAGDAFLSGVCVRLCEYLENERQATLETIPQAFLDDMAAFANGCGALVATCLGAMEAKFNRQDVYKLMAHST